VSRGSAAATAVVEDVSGEDGGDKGSWCRFADDEHSYRTRSEKARKGVVY
jgi:hypothetical protein